jgi:hypothetical protein
MVLICDNAPYHHAREIGSFSTRMKGQLVELMIQHNIEYINVPWNNNRQHAFAMDNYDLGYVEFNANKIKLLLDEENFCSRPTINNPFVPSLEELKIGIVEYLHANQPELLECKVELALRERGHQILWTPPYTPEFQPIENYWSIGKGHAALYNCNLSTMKTVVTALRDGWYGNAHLFREHEEKVDYTCNILCLDDSYIELKETVNCWKLFEKSIKMCNEKIQVCLGIHGSMGNIVEDDDYVPNNEGLPINMVILNITDGPVGIPLEPVNEFDEELDRFDAIAEELEGESLVLDDDSSESSGDF